MLFDSPTDKSNDNIFRIKHTKDTIQIKKSIDDRKETYINADINTNINADINNDTKSINIDHKNIRRYNGGIMMINSKHSILNRDVLFKLKLQYSRRHLNRGKINYYKYNCFNLLPLKKVINKKVNMENHHRSVIINSYILSHQITNGLIVI